MIGDMNGDGLLNLGDVSAFVLALTDRSAYDAAFPTILVESIGDVNGDLTFDLGDIGPFSALFGGPGSADAQSAPEPSSIALVITFSLGLGGITGRRRKS